MLAKRIIPCLDVKDGVVVKGINFVGLQEVGDAVELGRRYALEGADELVYLDISATLEGRKTFAELVARVAETVNIPFTVGGGIRSLDDASRLLDAGADKITLNSAAIARPDLIGEIAAKYGRQFVVVPDLYGMHCQPEGWRRHSRRGNVQRRTLVCGEF